MTIYLEGPSRSARGSDGQGWNRVGIGTVGDGPQCALQPTSYPTLIESLDTRQARWGGFGACVREGRCGECMVMGAAPIELRALTDRVLVRVSDAGKAYVMNKPEDGWASNATRWSWAQISRLSGWSVGESFSDEHSAGFWLLREDQDHLLQASA